MATAAFTSPKDSFPGEFGSSPSNPSVLFAIVVTRCSQYYQRQASRRHSLQRFTEEASNTIVSHTTKCFSKVWWRFQCFWVPTACCSFVQVNKNPEYIVNKKICSCYSSQILVYIQFQYQLHKIQQYSRKQYIYENMTSVLIVSLKPWSLYPCFSSNRSD